MEGIALSRNDKWLLILSVFLPPLATYMKFGRSRTLRTNCLLTLCLFLPGIVHAMRSIHRYPSVVFRQAEQKDSGVFQGCEGNVIWEVPRDHFRSISHSVLVFEAQSLVLKNDLSKKHSLPGGSVAVPPSLASSSDATIHDDRYMAFAHASAPVLNPGYGWNMADLLQQHQQRQEYSPSPVAMEITRPLDVIKIH
ncbi:hypothetical protein FBU59_005837 [Linderina macrospora]|uniref:Uncharacterized protein n=1 Tax=Linderina macrospora TaxID=4868 RepID=A0ACC1J1W0_9FUNG|nr:hypothetical protein FBU59_005837 [Linderina macrospora]